MSLMALPEKKQLLIALSLRYPQICFCVFLLMDEYFQGGPILQKYFVDETDLVENQNASMVQNGAR